jgi:hypothetical protein
MPKSLPQRQPRKRKQQLTVGVPRSLALARTGANDFGASISTGYVYNGYQAAKNYMRALADPIGTPEGLVHILDPYTSIPCEAGKNQGSSNLTIYNGTSAADGSLCFLLRGDSYSTIVFPATISAAHAVTWTGFSKLDTYSPYTSGFANRAILSFAKINIFQTGDPHVITLHAYRAPPNGVATQYGAGPTQTNYGCTQLQISQFQGTDQIVKPGDSIEFMSHETRGTGDFLAWGSTGSERGANGNVGHFIWLYGLRSTDRVELVYGSFNEFYPLTAIQSVLSTPAAVEATSYAADITLAAASSLTDVGADTLTNNSGAEIKRSTLSKVSDKITSLATSDAVDKGITAITDLVEGNFWGAIENGFGAVMSIFNTRLFQHQKLRMIDGQTLLAPPILPRASTHLPLSLQQHGTPTIGGFEEQKVDQPTPSLYDGDDDFPTPVTASMPTSSFAAPPRARSIPPLKKA